MSDDMVVFMVHLWGSTFTHFVYEHDAETDEPVRVVGIVDDLSSWSNDQAVDEMWDGATFEILSVFIDYDQDCRITFNLRNGERLSEPRFGDAWDGDTKTLSDSQRDEIRVWNVVKAHYQCYMSIWPFLIHTWSHFHFNGVEIQLF